jgi:nucleoside-diphosphate-sugar epimerase/predicted dehydrogenase
MATLLAQEHPDVVHVLTPPTTHTELAIQAMNAGSHVLVEKPMTVSLAEADQMIATARERGVKLCVDHNYLFKPAIVKTKTLVDSGKIGQVVYVNSYYGLSGEGDAYSGKGGHFHWAWRLPGGVFTNFLPHLVYLELAFLPQITGVAGVTVTRSDETAVSVQNLHVLLEGAAASGSMTVSMSVKPYAKFVDIYGTQGIIHADLVREVCTIHHPHAFPQMLSKAVFNLEDSVQLAAGTVANTSKVVLGRLKSMPGLAELIESFYTSILTNQDSPVPGEAGRKVTAIMETIWAKAPALSAAAPTIPVVHVTQGPQTNAERAVLKQGGIPGRVLVTGGTGFLGHHLVLALARCGAEVAALVRDPGNVAPRVADQAQLIVGDLRDPDAVEAAMQGVEVVYHCAAITSNAVSWREHYEVNVQGTETVFKAALKAGVKRVIYTSSVVVYGLEPPRNGGTIHESAPYDAETDQWAHYIRSKTAADKLAFELWREQSLPVTVLRLGILYGPGGGRPPGRGMFQLGALRFLAGNGHNRLPYTYVGNAVDCMLLATVCPAAIGQAYNVVDEPQISVREMSIKRQELVGENARLVALPTAMLSAAARFFEAKHNRNHAVVPPSFSSYVIHSAYRDVVYDTTKAQQQLGWKPEVSLDDALRKSIEASTG